MNKKDIMFGVLLLSLLWLFFQSKNGQIRQRAPVMLEKPSFSFERSWLDQCRDMLSCLGKEERKAASAIFSAGELAWKVKKIWEDLCKDQIEEDEDSSPLHEVIPFFWVEECSTQHLLPFFSSFEELLTLESDQGV